VGNFLDKIGKIAKKFGKKKKTPGCRVFLFNVIILDLFIELPMETNTPRIKFDLKEAQKILD